MKLKLDLNLYQDYLEIKNYLFFKKIVNCKKEQTKILKNILKENKNTNFGKNNSFSKIKSHAAYTKLPITNYESVKEEIEREKKGITNSIINNTIQYFATTSGTTNTPKFLPHTKNYIKKRKQAWEIWTHNLYKQRPETFSLKGSILTITAKPYDGYVFSNKKFGSISGQIHDMQPKLVKFLYAIPDELLQVDNFKLKYYLSVIYTLKQNLTLIVTPNPSTLLILEKTLRTQINQIIEDLETNNLKYLNEYKELPEDIKQILLNKFQKDKIQNKEIAKKLKLLKKEKRIVPKYIFTNLQSIGCWTGGSLKVYLKEVKKLYGENVTIRDIGYMASEGRFSIPIETKENGEGILDILTNYYEFIKTEDYEKSNPKIYLAHELEINQKYYILITNENGLYRYDINDIIQVTGFYKNTKTPLIVFVQKGKYFSSLTGEKVSEWEVNHTIQKLQEKLNPKIKSEDIKTFFVFPNISAKNPNYNYHIEFENIPTSKKIKEFEQILERELKTENMEYKEKRDSGRLNHIKIKILPKDSVKKLKQEFSKGKKNESQVKEPKLIILEKDIEIINNFLKNNNNIK